MKAFASLHPGGLARVAAAGSSTSLAHLMTTSASPSPFTSSLGQVFLRRYLQTQSCDRRETKAPSPFFRKNGASTSPDTQLARPGHQPSSSSPFALEFFSPHRPSSMARRPHRTALFSPTPVSLLPPPHLHPSGDGPDPLSDHEFEVRLGRAVSLLRATLSDFMRIGLVDYDTSHVSDASSSSGLGLSSLHSLGLGAILGVFGATSRAKERRRESLPPHLKTHVDCPVYHPTIVFKFHPPLESMESNPELSLKTQSAGSDSGSSRLLTFSGRTMYFGSAHILRHALSALFSETTILIETVKLHRGPPSLSPGSSQEGTDSNDGESSARPMASREATLVLRLTFTGVVRVTQQVHEYTVIFRYKFDPSSGMIIEHEVDKIEPAPGKKIWTGLSSAFSRLAGFPPPNPAPSLCQQTNRLSSTLTSLWEGHSERDSATFAQRRRMKDHIPLRWVPAPASLPRAGTGNVHSDRERHSLWQARRLYTTGSRAVFSSASHPATTAATGTSSPQRFFSHPRSAEDMPGPSVASIWLPSLGPSRYQDGHANAAEGLSIWAPPSNDPSVVTPIPNEAATMVDLSQYRPVPELGLKSLPKIVSGLSKSNLTFLVTLTGMSGYALCPSTLAVSSSESFLGPVGTLLALATGMALCSGAANAINQLREIPYDAQMARTRNRLLPSRTITPLQGATFAGISSVSGVMTLAMLNPLTAFLGLGNIFLYAFVYTPMKRRHIANTWVGAIVGALPPLMGWTACTGTLNLATDAPGWCLAALLFAWQFPHFNSLSHNLSSEYARGGYRMMSVVDPALNRRTSLRYALALLPICSLALPLSGVVAALPYALLSLPPNLILLQASWRFWRKGTEKSARWCFWVSLIHLPTVLLLAMATKKSLWDGVQEWFAGFAGEAAIEATAEREKEKEEEVE